MKRRKGELVTPQAQRFASARWQSVRGGYDMRESRIPLRARGIEHPAPAQVRHAIEARIRAHQAQKRGWK